MSRRKRCLQCNRLFRPDPRIGARQRTCSASECQRARHREQSLDYHRRQAVEIYGDHLAERTEREVGSELDARFYDRLAAARWAAVGPPSGETGPAQGANENSGTWTTRTSPFLRDEFWLEWRVILQASTNLAITRTRDERSQGSSFAERSCRSQLGHSPRDEMDRARSSA